MNRLRLRAEGGFTLIELLVVIAIIGILAAIAIPQFATYRRRGYGSQVKSDIRNIATAQEAYFVNANNYKTVSSPIESSDLAGYNRSGDVFASAAGTETTFLLTATHSKCNAGNVWTFLSNEGKINSPTGGCAAP